MYILRSKTIFDSTDNINGAHYRSIPNSSKIFS